MPREIGYPGFRSGRLVMVEKSYVGDNGNIFWKCQCDCGNITYKKATRVWNGCVKSCGCLQAQNRVEWGLNHKKGKEPRCGTRLYNIWKSMRERCYTQSRPEYKDYGGRGIVICDEWQDFSKFREWALANGYDPSAPRGQCTIDRIDVNGNYEPSNCRFTDMVAQGNNRRTNACVEYNGETHTIAEWAAILGINKGTLYGRHKKGFTGEKLFYRGDLRCPR